MFAADGMVNAVGVVLGTALDSFGVGGAVNAGFWSTSGSSPVLTAAVFGSGQTALASSNQSSELDALFAALGDQDVAANANVQGALDSSGAGRGQMNDVISATLDDVTGLAPGSNTNGGLLALVNALAGRLEQAGQVLTTGSATASTQAAGSTQVAAGYNSLVSSPNGGVASMGALSSMGGLSTGALSSTGATQSAMVPMEVWIPASAAASTAAASTAAQAASTQQAASNSGTQQATLTSATTQSGQPKLDPITVSTVEQNLKQGVGAVGETAARGYINQALNIMGITDASQRNTWTTDLLHGMFLESSWNPSALDHAKTYATTVMLSDGAYISCARGLMQCIPDTFAANHQAGTSNNIYDPVASICAGMWYLHTKYGVNWDGSNLASRPPFNPASNYDPGY